VEVLNKRRGLTLRTVASPAITDLYDTEHGTLLIHIPWSFVIAACLTGIAMFLITGFLGYGDSPFRQPWPLYLWLCALILALQCAILRHPTLRGRLVATLVVTLAGIAFSGITYFNASAPSALRGLLLLTHTGRNGAVYSILNFAVLNFAVIGGFWLSMLYRWRRRARHLPLRLAVNVGLEETIDVATTEPDLPRLIGGDLLFFSIVAALAQVRDAAEYLRRAGRCRR
jgi:hypothetical protein